MLSEPSSELEVKPLLPTSKPKFDSKPLSPTRKKLLISILLITIAIIIFVIIIFYGHKIEENKFVFTNEWTTLESVDTKYISKQWSFDSLCDENQMIQLTFAIKQQNRDLIHQKVYEVSNPSSNKFGGHWSMEEIHKFLKPKDDSIALILDWFNYYNIEKNNINYLTVNKDFIRIETTIKTANDMLNTEYANWINDEGAKHIRVKESYFVPPAIAEHLDFISPSLRFPPRRHTKTIEKFDINTLSVSGNSMIYNTPSRIRSLYQMNDYINSAAYENNYQAVASFLEEWYTDSDISTFWNYFNIDNVDLIRVPSIQPSGYGDEAELDVEYITSTGNGIKTLIWDIEDDLYFISLVQQMLENGAQASVVSMSYGGDEQSSGYSYCNRANIEFAKISLAGVTLLASSGDSGVSGDSDQCTDQYYPSFPASSPYVVAVGGTVGGTVTSNENTSTGEVSWIDSGGGFSLYFDRQSWQDDAVEQYFATASSLPDSSKYNANGRGYPDISAQSVDYIICVDSEYWIVSGTSCSCPSVAGMISLINDIRLQNGKSRLGWILPSLYSLLSEESYYFNDVVDGYNLGCANDDYVGFSAAQYWDPVTGLGTVKFSRLLAALYDL